MAEFSYRAIPAPVGALTAEGVLAILGFAGPMALLTPSADIPEFPTVPTLDVSPPLTA